MSILLPLLPVLLLVVLVLCNFLLINHKVCGRRARVGPRARFIEVQQRLDRYSCPRCYGIPAQWAVRVVVAGGLCVGGEAAVRVDFAAIVRVRFLEIDCLGERSNAPVLAHSVCPFNT